MSYDGISPDEWERTATGEERMPSAPTTARSGDETAALLRQILARLDVIVTTQAKHEQLLMRLGLRVKAIDERGAAQPQKPAAAAAPTSDPRRGEYGKAVASDRELDGEYGNPRVKRDPPRWKGDSMKDCLFSECPAEYLDELAGFLDWKASKDLEASEQESDREKADKAKKYAAFAKKDAARARGWADRLRRNPPKEQVPTATATNTALSADDNPWS